MVTQTKIRQEFQISDYVDTYRKQLVDTKEPYEWIKNKLTKDRQLEWEKTINALTKVCQVLENGFEPCTPPRNWASGQLEHYLAPIPNQVTQRIDIAEPIFGKGHILIYDPNTEHFSRPKFVDPLVVGFIDLAQQRLRFLIGQWDLDADLKFIKGSKRFEMAQNEILEVITDSRNWRVAPVVPWPTQTGDTMPLAQVWYGTGSGISRNVGNWSSCMTADIHKALL